MRGCDSVGNKKISFAGSTVGEPWWTAGEVVAKALEPHGYEVEIQAESGGQENVRWITDRRCEVGATTQGMLINALAGKGPYEGELHRDFTCIATFGRKEYLALAIRAGTGLRDLYDVKKKQYPLRILAGSGEEGSVLDTVLRHYGTNLDEIKEWGGKLYTWSGYLITEHMFNRPPVQVKEFDMMLGSMYLGYTPHNRYWYDATVIQDMRFLDFDEELIEKLLVDGNKRMTIPRRLYPGIDRDIPTVGTDRLYIYCLKDQPDELVRLIAESLDTNSDILNSVHVAFYYDREEVWKSPHIPLHSAAREYYYSKGYMK
jgi:TRAP-type uncharacterized transport system substrate-binding protein